MSGPSFGPEGLTWREFNRYMERKSRKRPKCGSCGRVIHDPVSHAPWCPENFHKIHQVANGGDSDGD